MRFFAILIFCFSGYLHAAKSGKETYQQYCTICHNSGLAGAPKFQSKADWHVRCEQKKLKGLLDSAIQGINAMPAKGTCDSCNADDIQEAIQYMVPNDEPQCHKK